MKINTLTKMRVVLYSEAVFSIEIFFATVMTAFYLNYIGLGFEQMSLFFSVSLVGSFFLEIPMGSFSDWFGRKRSFLLGKSIYLVALFSELFLKDFNGLLVVAFFLSVGSALSSGNLSSIFYENLESIGESREKFFTINSKVNSIRFLSSAIGAIAGGFLGQINLRLPLFLDCTSLFLIIVIGLIFIEESSESYKEIHRNHTSSESVLKQVKHAVRDMIRIMKEGFLLSLRNKKVISLFAFSSISFGVLRAGYNFYQPILSNLSVNLTEFGFILAIYNVIAAVISFLAGKLPRRYIDGKILVGIPVILLFISSLLVIHSNMVLLTVVSFALHQVIRGATPSFISYSINKEIPAGSHTRTMINSIDFFLKSVIGAIIMTLSGRAVKMVGLSQGFSYMSIFGAVIISIIYLYLTVVNRRSDFKNTRSMKEG